jgi:hypothetical protein
MSFEIQSARMLEAMAEHAQALGAQGVALVALMNAQGTEWDSRMKALGRTKEVPADLTGHAYPGYNFIAIAYSKAAEMADTRQDSGSGCRAAYQGEFGYPGGLIRSVNSGYVLVVFSGASGEQDLEIAGKGLAACTLN